MCSCVCEWVCACVFCAKDSGILQIVLHNFPKSVCVCVCVCMSTAGGEWNQTGEIVGAILPWDLLGDRENYFS